MRLQGRLHTEPVVLCIRPQRLLLSQLVPGRTKSIIAHSQLATSHWPNQQIKSCYWTAGGQGHNSGRICEDSKSRIRTRPVRLGSCCFARAAQVQRRWISCSLWFPGTSHLCGDMLDISNMTWGASSGTNAAHRCFQKQKWAQYKPFPIIMSWCLLWKSYNKIPSTMARPARHSRKLQEEKEFPHSSEDIEGIEPW